MQSKFSSQNISRQLEELKEHGIDDRDVFCDKQSGKDFDREQYKLLKKMVRSGDCVVVTELDRFGRDMNEIKEELHWFNQNDVEVKILEGNCKGYIGWTGKDNLKIIVR